MFKTRSQTSCSQSSISLFASLVYTSDSVTSFFIDTDWCWHAKWRSYCHMLSDRWSVCPKPASNAVPSLLTQTSEQKKTTVTHSPNEQLRWLIQSPEHTIMVTIWLHIITISITIHYRKFSKHIFSNSVYKIERVWTCADAICNL